jgi:hypothetical protein
MMTRILISKNEQFFNILLVFVYLVYLWIFEPQRPVALLGKIFVADLVAGGHLQRCPCHRHLPSLNGLCYSEERINVFISLKVMLWLENFIPFFTVPVVQYIGMY